MSTKIEVRESGFHNKGLFAKIPIKKGEVVFIIKGDKKKFLINNKKQAEKAGMNWVGVGKNEWIDPKKYCQFFNHSCDPNTKLKGRVTVIATKNIKKDEEITFDYSLNESDIFWKMEPNCMCRTSKCRGIIKSIQFLSEKEFNQRKDSVPSHFKNIFNKFKSHKFKDEKILKKEWIDFIEKDFNV